MDHAIDNQSLDLACHRVGVTGADRKASLEKINVLGVSPNTLAAYRKPGKRVGDAKLSVIFENLIELADTQGRGLAVRLLLYEAVGCLTKGLLLVAIELGPATAAVGIGDRMPLSAAVLDRGAAMAGVGDDAYASLIEWGDTRLAQWIFPAAAKHFEDALRIRPNDSAAALCAVKAQLQVSEGDIHARWARATALLDEFYPTIAESSAAWPQWELWRIVAFSRKDSLPSTFKEVYLALGTLADRLKSDAGRPDDVGMRLMLAELRGVALFRSGNSVSEQDVVENSWTPPTPEQGEAMKLLEALVGQLRQRHHRFQRGRVLKRWAIFHTLIPPEPENPPSADGGSHARQMIANLMRAVELYELSAECFSDEVDPIPGKGRDKVARKRPPVAVEALGFSEEGLEQRRVERARSEYSRASALMIAGFLHAERLKDPVAAAGCYARAYGDAITSALSFPDRFVLDLSNARYVVGDLHRVWAEVQPNTGDGRTEKLRLLQTAEAVYREVLSWSFTEQYPAKSEWAMTHVQLSKVCRSLAGMSQERCHYISAETASLMAAGTVLPGVESMLTAARQDYENHCTDELPFDRIVPATKVRVDWTSSIIGTLPRKLSLLPRT